MKMKGPVLTVLLLVAVTCPAQQSRNVVIAVVDGARYSETLGDTSHRYIPKIWSELRPRGTIFTKFYVDGTTTTNPGHATILTGTWQTIPNDGTQRPNTPTVFEYFRKETGSPQLESYVVLGKDKLNILSYGNHGAYGSSYGASVKTSTSPYDDGRTLANFTEVAAASHPRLTIINFAGTDNAGHSGVWNSYLSALQRVDSLVSALYAFFQADPLYRDSTTLIVVNDHGRHLDGVSDGFKSHGDGCEGCRHIMLLMIGPGVPAGNVDTTRHAQIDIAPTVGRMLGVQTPFVAGLPISSVLVTGVDAEQPRGEISCRLLQNYPNPFNPVTMIRYEVPAASEVSLRVYNTLGQEVATLLEHAQSSPGLHEVAFDATEFPTGVYMYRLIVSGREGLAATLARKFCVVK
jgi:hypothetical protein